MNKYFRPLFFAILPLILYACISFIYFGLHLNFDFQHQYLGMQSDPMGSIWNLNWWGYALQHHINPFLSKIVWAPTGYNLAETLPFPLLAVLLIPVTKTFGSVVTYNIAVVFMSTVCAYTAYYLCYYLTRRSVPALFGGYLFGFSSYIIGQTLAHLVLLTVFLLPLLLLLIAAYWKNDIKAITFTAIYALLLSCQFLLNPETYVTIALILGILALISFPLYQNSGDQKRIFSLCILIALSYLISAIIVSPYIYLFLAHHHAGYAKDLVVNSLDLFNIFIPTPITWAGGNQLIWISKHFHKNLFEAGGYLGIPLIFIIILFLKEFWGTKEARVTFGLFTIILIIALGPILHWRGHSLFRLPWALAQYIPVIKAILPARFSAYLALMSAIIASSWLAYSKHATYFKYFLAVSSIIFLLPNPHPHDGQWTTKITIPPFITTQAYRKFIKPNDIILTLPFSGDASCEAMLWQAKTKMYFRLANGCLGGVPFAIDELPITPFLQNKEMVVNPDDESSGTADGSALITKAQLKEFLNMINPSVVIIPQEHFSKWKVFLEKLHKKPIHVGGVLLYQLKDKSYTTTPN